MCIYVIYILYFIGLCLDMFQTFNVDVSSYLFLHTVSVYVCVFAVGEWKHIYIDLRHVYTSAFMCYWLGVKSGAQSVWGVNYMCLHADPYSLGMYGSVEACCGYITVCVCVCVFLVCRSSVYSWWNVVLWRTLQIWGPKLDTIICVCVYERESYTHLPDQSFTDMCFQFCACFYM